MILRLLRLLAVIGAVSLMVGEAYRSWGVGRPVAFWLDDMLAGATMLASAWALRQRTPLRHAWFSASWGIATGMLYGSFFGKLLDPAHSDPGNFDLGLLTALLGVAFALAVIGTVLSIVVAGEARQ